MIYLVTPALFLTLDESEPLNYPAIMPSDISQLIQAGFEHHRSGRLQEAEAIYRSILKQQPGHPDALHLLGVMAHQIGRNETAVALIEDAIKANPGEADFYNNCGEAYRALGKYDLAMERYRQALAIKPDLAGAQNNLGNALKDMGRMEEAITCYEQTLAIDPGFAMAHNNLGIALKEMGRTEEAINHFEQAITTMPGYAEAHNNLGNALLELGRPGDAVSHYQQAIAIMPGYAEAHSNLGNALRALERMEEAINHYQQAIAIKPDFAMAHYNLGIALDESGRPEQALPSYERAIALRPDYAEAYHNIGFVQQELGRTQMAVTSYKKALSIKPNYAAVHLHLSMLIPGQDQITVIKQLLNNSSLPETDAALYQFALGNIYDNAEMYDEAFEHYKKANDLKRKTITYDPKYFSDYVDRLIASYTKSFFQDNTGHGSASILPVFIVGLPRSGTTLVEQIISSHPQVYGAGELESIARIEKSITARLEASGAYPESMRSCNEAVKHEFAEEYLQELQRFSQDATRITNKDPGNFHRIGLIKTLFPNVRIIHCRRNALDTCTSIYVNHFVRGNEYAFDLVELGKYYLEYERLMAHWNELFPAEIMTVQYEDLVKNLEESSRRIIDHIRVNWDDVCLDFHENRRAVRTASSSQVRRPLYNSSINRWRHYEKHLAPLEVILRGN